MPQSPMPHGMDREVWSHLPAEMKQEVLEEWKQESDPVKKRRSLSPLSCSAAASISELDPDLLGALLMEELEVLPVPQPNRNLAPDNHSLLILSGDNLGRRTTKPKVRLSPVIEDEWIFAKPSINELHVEDEIRIMDETLPKDWIDDEFPPTVSSIDGIQGEGQTSNAKPMAARSSLAQKGWKRTNGLSHSKADLAIEWKRFGMSNGYCVVNKAGFRPDDVCQGGVGDCWFMSAMAVVAEREKLITQLLLSKDASGPCFFVRMFIDGEWKVTRIDNHFALHPKGQKRKRTADFTTSEPLAFCKSNGKQLWAPIIEKAYAKMHGSYRAISGGQIYEALFDLTGYPTEAIVFGGLHFNSEVTWVACCHGLVGCHAYSILEVRELQNVKIGRERKLDDYFGKRVPLSPGFCAEGEPLRLLKLRNPWGEKVWNGSFGAGSAEWTDELKKELNYNPAMELGCFWISYHDFLQRFIEVDVCFAHENWFTTNIPNSLPPQSSIARKIYELRVFEPTWIYFTLCQPNKRGKAYQKYFYTDVNLIILRINENSSSISVEDMRLFGPCRASHFDLVLSGDSLSGTSYLLIPFSVQRQLSLVEEDLDIIGAGGKVDKARNAIDAPFTLRLMSANAVSVRERDWDDKVPISKDDLWDNVERSFCDGGIVNRHSLGSPTLVFQKGFPAEKPTAYLHIFETCGISIAHLVNQSSTTDCFVRMHLRASTKTSTATKAKLWRHVPPKSRSIVAACISPSYEAMAEFRLISLEELEVIMDSQPIAVSDDPIAPIHETGLLGVRQIQ
ncbi:hypothetical protein BC829DRAFT_384962 [Chytridium lagenaria]|nr:hypothetical protein BC829DRAFT_384962 [Chytridium lagenaria]